jgi:hypothetical protein
LSLNIDGHTPIKFLMVKFSTIANLIYIGP